MVRGLLFSLVPSNQYCRRKVRTATPNGRKILDTGSITLKDSILVPTEIITKAVMIIKEYTINSHHLFP